MTPFPLLYGRAPSTMFDAMLIPNINDDQDTPVHEFVRRAEDARALARQRIEQHQLCNAARYDLPQRHAAFAPGNRVWVLTPVRHRGLSEKLMRRYFGPYTGLR